MVNAQLTGPYLMKTLEVNRVDLLTHLPPWYYYCVGFCFGPSVGPREIEGWGVSVVSGSGLPKIEDLVKEVT